MSGKRSRNEYEESKYIRKKTIKQCVCVCVPLCFCFHKIANQVDVERKRKRRIEQREECEE